VEAAELLLLRIQMAGETDVRVWVRIGGNVEWDTWVGGLSQGSTRSRG
jgi:hypothetical protein